MPTVQDGYLRKILGKEEKVLLVVRQHGIFLFWHMFPWLAATVLIAGLTLALQIGTPDKPIMIALLVALAPLLVMWWQYATWDNHKYVMTNRRVLQMSGVLGKEVVDSLLDQINDVKTDQSLFGRIFNYGDVEILTASDIQTNKFHNIARPLEFKRTLLDAKEAISHPKPAS
jgi:uncharacterized membrane protein YdbT with pleckstrin-like domain